MPLEARRQLGPYENRLRHRGWRHGRSLQGPRHPPGPHGRHKVLPEHVASDPDLKQRFQLRVLSERVTDIRAPVPPPRATAWCGRAETAPKSRYHLISRRRLLRPGGNASIEMALSAASVAITMVADGQDDIWNYNVADHTLELVTTHPADDRSPLWTLDEQELVFSSNRAGGEWGLF